MNGIEEFKKNREMFLNNIESFLREQRSEMEYDKEDKEVTKRIVALIIDYCSNIYKFSLIPEDHIYHNPDVAEKIFYKLDGALNGMMVCRCINLSTKKAIVEMIKNETGLRCKLK